MSGSSFPKLYCCQSITTPQGDIVIEGPVSGDLLAAATFHSDLRAFRPPLMQQQALNEIAHLPEGRIVIARAAGLIVGYVTYLYPDPIERWYDAHLDSLLELGAIEVAREYRGLGLAKKLLEVSFQDDAMNDFIVFSTEYYWHWDLKVTGLSILLYKEVMKKVMGSVGMEWCPTDDPEINSHPANMLMARIGSRVSSTDIEKFYLVRFQTMSMF